jgi:hypothetical protein
LGTNGTEDAMANKNNTYGIGQISRRRKKRIKENVPQKVTI